MWRVDVAAARDVEGNIGLNGLADAAGDGRVARLWHCPAHRAGQPRRYLVESRDDLRVVGPAATARVDQVRVGHLRKQPEGQVLFNHGARVEAARGDGGELGTAFGGDRAVFRGGQG